MADGRWAMGDGRWAKGKGEGRWTAEPRVAVARSDACRPAGARRQSARSADRALGSRGTRMEDLMIRLAFLFLALTPFTPALAQPATASAELTGEARSRIDAAIDKAMTEQRLVGAVVLVSRDGKLV